MKLRNLSNRKNECPPPDVSLATYLLMEHKGITPATLAELCHLDCESEFIARVRGDVKTTKNNLGQIDGLLAGGAVMDSRRMLTFSPPQMGLLASYLGKECGYSKGFSVEQLVGYAQHNYPLPEGARWIRTNYPNPENSGKLQSQLAKVRLYKIAFNLLLEQSSVPRADLLKQIPNGNGFGGYLSSKPFQGNDQIKVEKFNLLAPLLGAACGTPMADADAMLAEATKQFPDAFPRIDNPVFMGNRKTGGGRGGGAAHS